MWSLEERSARRHHVAAPDQRAAFARDTDRVLYCSAFRRLGGITQVFRSGELDVFHTRLTHSLKVSQLGRRLAEKLIHEQEKTARFYNLDPEVVAAACLSHDLGHPPFGHIGEQTINELVQGKSDPDGFEGNAQSFRIITKLAIRFSECEGLDLTRATLAACLKYPWKREPGNADRDKKWGVYRSEEDDFSFIGEAWQYDCRTAEAEIMDFADDIAYSVHDLEDLHRCALVPWYRLIKGIDGEELINSALGNWHRAPGDANTRLRTALQHLEDFLQAAPEMISEPYEATRLHREQIRTVTSQLIGRCINGIKLTEEEVFQRQEKKKCVDVDPDTESPIRVMKQITRDFIKKNNALAAQQHGQKRVITELFNILYREIHEFKTNQTSLRLLPKKFHHIAQVHSETAARSVADCIASLTESEAVALHARLTGIGVGSVLDPIVR